VDEVNGSKSDMKPSHHNHSQSLEGITASLNLVSDPVYRMKVDSSKSKLKTDFEGKTYYFCNPKCESKFKAEPKKYLAKTQTSISSAASDKIYTCPMHPEIRQKGPGSCPICGMAIEPIEVSLDHEEDKTEYLGMLKRFWVSSLLTLPLLLITMGDRWFMAVAGFEEYSGYLLLVLASPVVLWGGWPFFERFWQSLRNKSPNMFTLIGLGVGVAYVCWVQRNRLSRASSAFFSRRRTVGARPRQAARTAMVTTAPIHHDAITNECQPQPEFQLCMYIVYSLSTSC
jgi:Cu+-exporting ATPase